MSLASGRLHLVMLVALAPAFLIALVGPITHTRTTETGLASSGHGFPFEKVLEPLSGAALVSSPHLVAAGSVAPEATSEATPEPAPSPQFVVHIIQPGDAISSIAAAYGIDQRYILWNNPDVSDDPDMLAVGQELVIPSVNGIIYHVKLGDTLSDIASYYGIDVQSIIAFGPNNLATPDSINEKAVLVLPGAVPPPPPPIRTSGDGGAAVAMASPAGGLECSNTMTVYATWYTAAIAGGSGVTATGTAVYKGIISVDPGVIPLGTRMYIPGYGYGVAADTGGAIQGNMIDLGYGPNDGYDWSTRWVEICILP